MAIRKPLRYDLAGIREHLTAEHARVILRWAEQLDDDVQAARSRRWIEAVRAGEPVRVYWWELPEGSFGRGGHDPNDDVIVDAGGIRWASEEVNADGR